MSTRRPSGVRSQSEADRLLSLINSLDIKPPVPELKPKPRRKTPPSQAAKTEAQ